MFFLFLCILLWALFAFDAAFDQFGWLMLVATGWFCGFMDSRNLAKDKSRGIPPDTANERGDDGSLFSPN